MLYIYSDPPPPIPPPIKYRKHLYARHIAGFNYCSSLSSASYSTQALEVLRSFPLLPLPPHTFLGLGLAPESPQTPCKIIIIHYFITNNTSNTYIRRSRSTPRLSVNTPTTHLHDSIKYNTLLQ